MSQQQLPSVRSETVDQIAGITGIGWTVSVLGFLSTVFGYGNVIVARVVADPFSLLYLGGVLFLTTLGLDRLERRLSDGEG
jgi:hypothetical protein